ncbi:antirepressor [Mesorhizobium sp. L-8-3]|nr:antirepressor [Mesorhizobium sp. L-8-3]
MSRHHRHARAGADRTSLYDEITGKIIADLEAGRFPWVQPWGTSAATAPLGLPKNASTGRAYSGINILILWGAVVQHGFPGQGWLTFRQALSFGGNVRKGERGTTVVYADRFVPEDEKQRARDTGEEAQAIPFLNRFTVFNVAQCEGLPEDIAVELPPPPPGMIEPTVEALIEATGIDFRIGGDRAYYVPAHDYVMVPPPAAYFEPINWHRTALHELGHATGHASRLGRDLGGSFGSKKYGFEELVGGDERGLLLRRARHCPDRAPCRLPWLLARSAARGQPRDRARGLAGQQGRRLAARFPARCRRRH